MSLTLRNTGEINFNFFECFSSKIIANLELVYKVENKDEFL